MKAFKKILPNGLKIISIPLPDHLTTTVLVLVRAGSEYETKKTNGLFHFLEHMCFKGTTRRPSSKIITTELDSMGAQYNAFTGNEFTGYFVKSKPNDFKKALDIVSDIYMNALLPPEEFEKERGVIKEEINMYNDLPQRKVHHILMEVMYGDQPAGWSIAGTKENIDAMKVSDLLSNRDKFYVSNNTLVVVAGGIFDHLSAENEVEQIFSSIRTGSPSQKHQVSEKQSVPSVKIEDKDTDQVHFSVGFRTFNVFDKRNPILKTLISILDGGMSARLFHRLREELGICYYVRADLESFADYGFCTISAGVNTERFIEALMAVKDELVKLKKETVTELELSKAKSHLSGNIFLGLEGSDSVAEFFGFQEIMKDEMQTPQDIVAEIDCVLSSDVYNLANVIFTSSNSNLAVIGRVGEEDKKRANEILLSLD